MYCGIAPVSFLGHVLLGLFCLCVSHTAIIGFAKGDEIKAHSSNLEPLRHIEKGRAGELCVPFLDSLTFSFCLSILVCLFLSLYSLIY